MNSFILGLTGSIAMGKTTVSEMFKDLGVPVWCADTAVQDLYRPNAEGTRKLKKFLPTAVDKNGVNREILKNFIHKDNEVLKKIENLIHPLLQRSKEIFIKENQLKPLVVFDIPLLFEKNQQKNFDATLLVTASEETQRKRALLRGKLSKKDFELIKKKQLNEEKKISKATFVFNTDKPIEETQLEVKLLQRKILNKEIVRK